MAEGSRSTELLPVEGPLRTDIRLDDGVVLAADIWRPAVAGRFPVLLLRQPYGRRIASTVVLAHPAWYAAHGYVVAIQDVRGQGDSSGRFRVLADDGADGAASLAWAADLPHGDGRVATYGFSYHAITQYLAMAGARRAGSKRPDAIAPVMGAYTVRDDWVYEGGALRLALIQNWACQMAAEQARRAGDTTAYHALRRAAAEGCHLGPVPAHAEILHRYARYTHYRSWLEDDPATLARVSPALALQDDPLDVPALHVGGWLDFMLEGTLAADRAFRDRSAARQRLIVGPWPHLPWGRRLGRDLGPTAGVGIDAEIVSFFDRELKGMGVDGPAYRLFDLGSRGWRDFDELATPFGQSFYLESGGLAATSTEDGRLVVEPGAAGEDFLVHDPWRPAPAVGLHLGDPPGYVNRGSADDRSDVLVYTSAPLAAPLVLAGPVAAELFVVADQPSHDLNCTLSVVWRDGEGMALTGGHLRVPDASADGPRRVAMRATCATIPAGAALRLSIQAAAWPAFALNPGSGKRAEDTSLAGARVTTLRVQHGGANPSRLLLTRAPD